jgi:hypothetical protein
VHFLAGQPPAKLPDGRRVERAVLVERSGNGGYVSSPVYRVTIHDGSLSITASNLARDLCYFRPDAGINRKHCSISLFTQQAGLRGGGSLKSDSRSARSFAHPSIGPRSIVDRPCVASIEKLHCPERITGEEITVIRHAVAALASASPVARLTSHWIAR